MTPSLFKMHYTIFLEARKEKKENKNKQKSFWKSCDATNIQKKKREYHWKDM